MLENDASYTRSVRFCTPAGRSFCIVSQFLFLVFFLFLFLFFLFCIGSTKGTPQLMGQIVHKIKYRRSSMPQQRVPYERDNNCEKLTHIAKESRTGFRQRSNTDAVLHVPTKDNPLIASCNKVT
jgi:hypothetical protein